MLATRRYETHLLIKGYEQTDCGETYAPVTNLVSFRMLVALAARFGLELDQMDVTPVFLNPQIEGEVFVELR
jgi:hypothetical protein